MNPKDARHGDGVYFTRISPAAQLTRGAVSTRLFGVPWNRAKLEAFVVFDIKGLPQLDVGTIGEIVLVPTSVPLNITGRIFATGPTEFLR